MTQALENKKVAILVADGFEQAELTKPQQALEAAGAQTQIVSPQSDRVQGWNHFDKGDFSQSMSPSTKQIQQTMMPFCFPVGWRTPISCGLWIKQFSL